MNRGLIVSCQALPEEPLHSSFIMGRMALAAKEGGAVGIRANSVEDIEEIKKHVDLPIIGIIKKVYEEGKPYITPTLAEVDALVRTGVDVVAVDATINQDVDFLYKLHEKYPHQKFMADISTEEEGLRADEIGFDFVGLTLLGYTPQSQGLDKFQVLQSLIAKCEHPVIAEGNFSTPEQAAKAIESGAYAVVVGTAITRPQCITRGFAEAVSKVFN
ncbi:N-acylglucosamine-6-phosphate 2-epimerase [Lacrimispora sphenoides]|jgi:N-acylglucosamine-6-phosphate 2-epimerase|uniref:N-acetylmannosamine-6-phosphate 2-epimerase n=1 Tax=Lacrimispora sphenoides TaxID=29370 RepID=UPI0008C8773B|nr:N-acetylmannosamine-6-phosphate 2-epimerase [Lacrimispora sphenoides]SEU31765.1 N-acylglucosamine-6-phosphate 2-epimerase [Lacrimispora sphenoides]